MMSAVANRESIPRSPLARLRSRPLLSVLLLNFLLFALYAWTATETTEVQIAVHDDRLVASVNGFPLAVADSAGPGDNIALILAGPEQRRTYVDSGPPPGSPIAWLGAVAARLQEEPLGTAWQRVTVFDSAGHILRDEQIDDGKMTELPGTNGDWRAMLLGPPVDDQRSSATTAATTPAQYTLRATLGRSITPAGIMVRASDTGNGVMLLVRPEYRDFQWWRLDDGQWTGPLAAGGWGKTGLDILKDDLRLLLVTQQAALATLIVLAAFCLLVAWSIRILAKGSGRRAARDLDISASTPVEGYRAADTDQADPPDPITTPHREMPPERLEPSLPFAPLFAVLLAVATTGVTAYIAYFVLEAMPHVQDSVTYLFQARVFAMGRLWVPASPIPQAFEQEFIVNYAGRAFGKYTPGHPLILVPGVLAGVPWLINPLQSGLTIFVAYRIGCAVYSKGSALFAGILIATSPFFLFMSGSMMAHPTELLFISLFVLLFVKTASPQASLKTGLLAGAALGFAFLTRPYTAMAMAAPFALFAGYHVLRSRGQELRRYGPLVLGLTPMVLVLPAYNYALTGNPLQNLMLLWWPFDKVGFGSGIGISGMFTVPDGLWNTYRNLTELMKHLYGWPAYLTLALVLLPFLMLRAGRWDWLFLSASFALIVAHIAWWADGIMYGPRYYYEALVLLALLTARGTAVLADVLRDVTAIAGGIYQGASTRTAKAAAYLFVLVLIAFNVTYYLPEQWSLYHGYNYVNGAALRAVRAADIHHAVVFVDLGKWYEWWNYGEVFSANTPTLNGDVVYARDRGEKLNSQVMGLYPGRDYYSLSGTTIKKLPPPR